MLSPGRNGVETAGGVLLAMPGWVPGSPMGVKLVAAFHGNPALGLPGHQALIALFDPETGTPLVVMDGTHVTALRTAGGAALTTRLLARPDARVMAIIGGGVQAVSHAHLLPLVRDIAEIRVCTGRSKERSALAAVDARCRVAATAEEAVRDADIVCLCTSATEPPVRADWIAPGTHGLRSAFIHLEGNWIERSSNVAICSSSPGKRRPTAGWERGAAGHRSGQGNRSRRGHSGSPTRSGVGGGNHGLQVDGACDGGRRDRGLVYQAALAEGVGTTFAMENRP